MTLKSSAHKLVLFARCRYSSLPPRFGSVHAEFDVVHSNHWSVSLVISKFTCVWPRIAVRAKSALRSRAGADLLFREVEFSSHTSVASIACNSSSMDCFHVSLRIQTPDWVVV
jgi:hypothetical protein